MALLGYLMAGGPGRGPEASAGGGGWVGVGGGGGRSCQKKEVPFLSRVKFRRFKAVGALLYSLTQRAPPSPEAVRSSLKAILPGTCMIDTYTMSQKQRTFQICEGCERSTSDRHKKMRDWHLGHNMSDGNHKLWMALGRPTAQQFDHMIGRHLPAFDRGYYISVIGGVVGKFVEEEDFLGKLQTLPARPDKWLSPALKLEKYFTVRSSLVDGPKKKRRKIGDEEETPSTEVEEIVAEPGEASKADVAEAVAEVETKEEEVEQYPNDGVAEAATEEAKADIAENIKADDDQVECDLENLNSDDEPGTDDDHEGAEAEKAVAAEGGNAGEEARAAAEIEEPKRKRPRRTKAEVYGAKTVDIASELQYLLPKVAAMRESMGHTELQDLLPEVGDERIYGRAFGTSRFASIVANLLNAEKFLVARPKKDEILACLLQIQNLPVCPCCFIELPSRACLESGCESWRFQDRKLVCSHCGKRALYDGSAAHWKMVRESLRHRVRAECELALHSPESDGRGMVSKELKAILKDLNIGYGLGFGGPKNKHKEIIPVWVVGQINRTLQRLFFEPDLRKERKALLVALRLLGAR